MTLKIQTTFSSPLRPLDQDGVEAPSRVLWPFEHPYHSECLDYCLNLYHRCCNWGPASLSSRPPVVSENRARFALDFA